jgi:hypothetical protein
MSSINKKIIAFYIMLIVLFLAFTADLCLAEEETEAYRQKIELLTGFGKAKLQSQGNYYIVPLFVAFNFDLAPGVKKEGIFASRLMQYALEPFVAYAAKPDNNLELGTNVLIKIGLLPEKLKCQPYFKTGLGIIYMTQHLKEQASQLNFNEFGGLGMHYFFNKNAVFTLDYRFRHISNLGIKHPNRGIDTHLGLCSFRIRF